MNRRTVPFYLPALLCSAAALVLFGLAGEVSLLWVVWLAALWAAGWLLARGHAWGCLPGLYPALHLLVLSSRYTGQTVDIERPLGLLLALYVAACGVWVWRRARV